jgi:hypothetical protein
MRPEEVGAFETGLAEVSAFEMRPAEVGAFEMRLEEDGALEMRLTEVGTFEVRVEEVGAFEMRPAEAGAAKVSGREIEAPASLCLVLLPGIRPAADNFQHSRYVCRGVWGGPAVPAAAASGSCQRANAVSVCMTVQYNSETASAPGSGGPSAARRLTGASPAGRSRV